MNDSFEENRELLSKCFSGDRKSSENFIRRFSSLVYKSVQYTLMAKQVPFNKQDLEDLHHSVFLKLFERGFAKLRQ
jgi:hypothetical protein